MISQFYFKNFEADEELRVAANLTLSRILDSAPYDSMAVAILEWKVDGYRCGLDIYTKHGPFMATAFGLSPLDTLQTVEQRLKNQILFWRSHRSGPRPPKNTNIQAAS